MTSEAAQTRQSTTGMATTAASTSSTQPSNQRFTPKSSHTADDFLQDFLDPAFDAAAFLNKSLPPLALRHSSSQTTKAVPLTELSTQAETLNSQLNTQLARLSNTLTQLTDDILRSGTRLAYQVELLRGETLSFEETLHERLQDDIKVFIPGGLPRKGKPPSEDTRAKVEEEGDEKARKSGEQTPKTSSNDGDDPSYVKRLQMLTLVKSRLESVVKVFGDAMKFTFPPSEVSVSSLSVSAPDPGPEQQSSEEKGQQVLQQLRDEISSLMKDEDPLRGIEKAASRVEELQTLTSVWKGTAEEKGRNKFIESLAKMMGDRHRELMRELNQERERSNRSATETGRRRGSSRGAGGGGGGGGGASEESRTLPGGFGLISQLQKLRGGL